jgi:hypothetical protein
MKSSYEKITLGLCATSVIVLLFLLFDYNHTMEDQLLAMEKIELLTAAKSLFDVCSLAICAMLWFWANFLVFKTKQFFWLWLPFVCVCFCTYYSSKMGNTIFVFQKQNNMWNGSFSIGYIAGVFGILFVGIILWVGYFVLKKVIKI